MDTLYVRYPAHILYLMYLTYNQPDKTLVLNETCAIPLPASSPARAFLVTADYPL